MAKRRSKKPSTSSSRHNPLRIRDYFIRLRAFIQKKRIGHIRLHKSFRRSYREDYHRELEVPGITAHLFTTFKTIFKNWKLFCPLLIIVVILNIVLVGLMSEATYHQFQDILDETSDEIVGGNIGNVARASLLLISTITTGGLSSGTKDSSVVFLIIIILIIWLTTIFLLRHIFAKHKVKLRDGLYNAMTPLISTFVILTIVFVQCIPIFLLIIVYSTAIQTEFLATPFYAFIFFIFAVLMLLTSGYLLSSSLIALVAVTAPGLYPLKALSAASDLMAGRRIKFVIRLIALILALSIVWVIVMLPFILFDLWIKTFEWTSDIPFVPLCLLTMFCFTIIYISTYLYIYYRWMLDYEEK